MSPLLHPPFRPPLHRIVRALVVGLLLAAAGGGLRAQRMVATSRSAVTAAITPDGRLMLRWAGLGFPAPSAFRILRAVGAGDYMVVGEVDGGEDSFTQPIGGLAEPLLYQVVAVYEDRPGQLVGLALVDPAGARGGATDGTIGAAPGVATPSARVLSPDAVLLTWAPQRAAAGFRILRSLNGGTVETIAELPRGAARYTDSIPGLLSRVPRYQIEWIDAGGLTSQPVGFNDVARPQLAGLARPRATVLGADSVRLTWMPGPLAVGFRVLRAFRGEAFQEIARLPAGAGQLVDRAPGLLARMPRYEIVWTDANGLDSVPYDFSAAARPGERRP